MFRKRKLAEEAEKKEENRIREEMRETWSALQAVITFPGSISEFREFSKISCEVLDLQGSQKGITSDILKSSCGKHDHDLQKKLVLGGIVTIVNATPVVSQTMNGSVYIERYYGLPVREAEGYKGC